MGWPLGKQCGHKQKQWHYVFRRIYKAYKNRMELLTGVILRIPCCKLLISRAELRFFPNWTPKFMAPWHCSGGSESAALHLHHPSRPALTILSQSSIQSCLACSSQRQHGATAIGKGQKQLHPTSPDPGTPFLAPYGSGEVPSLEKAGEGWSIGGAGSICSLCTEHVRSAFQTSPIQTSSNPVQSKKTSEKCQNMCSFFQDHCEHVVPVWWFHVVSTGLHTSYSLNILKKMKLKISLALRYEIMALEYPLPLEV